MVKSMQVKIRQVVVAGGVGDNFSELPFRVGVTFCPLCNFVCRPVVSINISQLNSRKAILVLHAIGSSGAVGALFVGQEGLGGGGFARVVAVASLPSSSLKALLGLLLLSNLMVIFLPFLVING
jgi:hypothetical protein